MVKDPFYVKQLVSWTFTWREAPKIWHFHWKNGWKRLKTVHSNVQLKFDMRWNKSTPPFENVKIFETPPLENVWKNGTPPFKSSPPPLLINTERPLTMPQKCWKQNFGFQVLGPVKGQRPPKGPKFLYFKNGLGVPFLAIAPKRVIILKVLFFKIEASNFYSMLIFKP